MKIGILTYHRVHNYGAILQAIALREVLIRMGNDVYFVDYYPEYHQRLYSLFDRQVFRELTFKRKLKYLLRFCFSFVNKYQRKKTFERYIKANILPYCKPLSEEYDCVVYGSDQIWRKQPFTGEYNPIYFGDSSIKCNLRIAYAASFNYLPEEKDINYFIKLVNQFDKVSVRERQLRDVIVINNEKDIAICVDPTLLLNRKDWFTHIRQKRLIQKKYILLYDLIAEIGGSTFDPIELELFAKRNNCIIVNLRSSVNKFGYRTDRCNDDPYDFINLILHSECVLTSSYHGIAFSILMHKPFYSCFPIDSTRAEYLLEVVGLYSRMVRPLQKMPGSIEDIDYTYVDARLSKLRADSLSYLKNCLKDA